ncbi:hypothetical protein B2G71_18110 [Novosphingobium sp. PC22D]|nr:hypothetical protein B2G71_18110 [Novosphingobium sp. PC22D]
MRGVPLPEQSEPLVTGAVDNRRTRRKALRERARAERAAQAIASAQHNQQSSEQTYAPKVAAGSGQSASPPWQDDGTQDAAPLPRNRSLIGPDTPITVRLRAWFGAIVERVRGPAALSPDEASRQNLIRLREDVATMQRTLDRMIGNMQR